MLGVLLTAVAALPTPAQLAPVPRLIQGARPVYCAAARRREVALTFDDGPGPYTQQLVRVLRRAHVRATFFDVGSRVVVWPSSVRAEARVGEIGNHTWNHPQLTTLSLRAVERELAETQAAIGRAGGRLPVLFRPPYEEATPAIDLLARRLDLLDLRWSVDSGDARVGARPRRVVRTAVAGLRPGAIVLFHDLHPWTPHVAMKVVRAARRKGLRPVTVSELLARGPPTARTGCG